MTEWFRDHPVITFVVLYIGLVFVYTKVFRMRRLPILKEAVIYLLIAVGALILWLFQLDLRMPIVQCMLAALALMMVVRIRLMITNKGSNSDKKA